MNVCIYSGEKFETATKEHILQASLGTRWTSDKLICDEMQKQFGNGIDKAVSDAVAEIRNLFGAKNGRGVPAKTLKHVKTSVGPITLSPGMQPSLEEPTYKILEKDDGEITVCFSVNDESQLPRIRSKFKRENPQLSLPDNGTSQVENSQTYLPDSVQLRLKFGGKDFFRGILKSSFNLLGMREPEATDHPNFQPLKDFILEGRGDFTEFVRFVETSARIVVPAVDEIDNGVFLWSEKHSVYGLFQFFGDLPFLLKLGEDVGVDSFKAFYTVDPLRRIEGPEIRGSNFDHDKFPKFEDSPKTSNSDVLLAWAKRVKRVVTKATEQADSLRISQIIEESFPEEGEIFTEAHREKVHQKLLAFIMHKLGIGS